MSLLLSKNITHVSHSVLANDERCERLTNQFDTRAGIVATQSMKAWRLAYDLFHLHGLGALVFLFDNEEQLYENTTRTQIKYMRAEQALRVLAEFPQLMSRILQYNPVWEFVLVFRVGAPEAKDYIYATTLNRNVQTAFGGNVPTFCSFNLHSVPELLETFE